MKVPSDSLRSGKLLRVSVFLLAGTMAFLLSTGVLNAVSVGTEQKVECKKTVRFTLASMAASIRRPAHIKSVDVKESIRCEQNEQGNLVRISAGSKSKNCISAGKDHSATVWSPYSGIAKKRGQTKVCITCSVGSAGESDPECRKAEGDADDRRRALAKLDDRAALERELSKAIEGKEKAKEDLRNLDYDFTDYDPDDPYDLGTEHFYEDELSRWNSAKNREKVLETHIPEIEWELAQQDTGPIDSDTLLAGTPAEQLQVIDQPPLPTRRPDPPTREPLVAMGEERPAERDWFRRAWEPVWKPVREAFFGPSPETTDKIREANVQPSVGAQGLPGVSPGNRPQYVDTIKQAENTIDYFRQQGFPIGAPYHGPVFPTGTRKQECQAQCFVTHWNSTSGANTCVQSC